MRVFYNDTDPFCCAWLSNLMDGGHIRPGTISDTSISDLTPEDVHGYDLAHFFAGIGGWDHALTLAGWAPDGRVWWTGSCPCQPFSAAGKRQAHDDARHLWPSWVRLIRECRPERVFGEQVASAIGLGWLDLVSTDLEAEGYTVGAVVLGAHSVGAPHRRQRLWFVADTKRDGWGSRGAERARPHGRAASDGASGGDVADRDRGRREQWDAGEWGLSKSHPDSVAGELGYAKRPHAARFRPFSVPVESEQETGRCGDATPWAGFALVGCADGKSRPVEPTIFPLAHGIPDRVGLLRGAGNAIVPQVAAAFVRAYLECRP